MKGKNTISGATWSIYLENAKMAISGTGSLDCESFNMTGGDWLVVDGPEVSVSNFMLGKDARIYVNSLLSVGKCLKGFDGIAYPDEMQYGIVSPSGARYDTKLKMVIDGNGNEVTTGVILGKKPVGSDYSLTVTGIRVSSINASRIEGEGIKGFVSFDEASQTLRLNKATISAGPGAITYSGKGTLTLQLQGANSVGLTTRAIVVEDGASLVIEGSGSLDAQGIAIDGGGNLTINDAQVTMDTNSIVAGSTESQMTMSGSNARLDVSDLRGFGSLTLNDGLGFTEPSRNCTYSTTDHIVVDADGKPADGRIKIAYAASDTAKGELYVCGKRVLGGYAAEMAGGTVSYNPTTKTLTLKNATLPWGTNPIHNVSVEGLKIVLEGTNNMRCYGGIMAHCWTKITGDGTLNIESLDSLDSGYAGIVIIGDGNTPLMITGGATVNVKAEHRGVRALNGQEGLVVVGNASELVGNASEHCESATLTVEPGEGYEAISGFGKTTLTGSKVSEPEGGFLSTGLGGITADGATLYKGRVVIGPKTPSDPEDPEVPSAPSAYYGLTIGGVEVTDLNASAVKGENIGGGGVRYEPESHTLKLSGATIGGNTPISVGNDYDGQTLTIVVEGNTELNAVGTYAIALDKAGIDVTIEGTHTLTARTNAGLRTNAQTLTIGGGCQLTLSTMRSTGEASLTVRGSATNVTLRGDGSKTLSGFTLVKLDDGLAYDEPRGSSYDPSARQLTDGDGQAVTGRVRIGQLTATQDNAIHYGLTVAGIEVTNRNKGAITGTGISGEVSYDSSTHTLALLNATIDGPIAMHGDAPLNRLVLSPIGICTIGGEGVSLSVNKDTYAEGTGTLVLVGGTELTDGAGLSLHVPTEVDYIHGASGDETLTASKALTVRKSITGLQALTTNGVGIITPQGGRYDTVEKTVVDKDGNAVNTGITIGVVTDVPATEEPIDYVWYNIEVGGTTISNANMKGVTGEGITGLVSYDPTTKTLTLQDATIDCGDEPYGLYITDGEQGLLTIVLKGDNRIITGSDDVSALYSYRNLSFKGTGTLTANGGIEVVADATEGCNIQGCTLNVRKIRCAAGSDMTLTIDNANVNLITDFSNVKQLVLKDAVIMSPAGAEWQTGTESGWLYVPDSSWKGGLSIVSKSASKEITLKARDFTCTYNDYRTNIFDLLRDSLTFTSSGQEPLLGEPLIVCELSPEGLESPNINFDAPAGTYNISISQGSVRNLKVKYVGGKMTIAKSKMNIVARSHTMKQGDNPPATAFDYEQDFRGTSTDDDFFEQIDKVKVSCDVNRQSEPDDYPVTVSGPAGSKNYVFSYVPGTISVRGPGLSPSRRRAMCDAMATRIPSWSTPWRGRRRRVSNRCSGPMPRSSRPWANIPSTSASIT